MGVWGCRANSVKGLSRVRSGRELPVAAQVTGRCRGSAPLSRHLGLLLGAAG